MEVSNVLTQDEDGKLLLCVKVNGNKVAMALHKVLYFMSENRRVIAVLKHEKIAFYGKLGELEAMIGQADFYRCHQSFLVNSQYIVTYHKASFHMENDYEVPISRGYQKKMEQMILSHNALKSSKKGHIIFTAGQYIGKVIDITGYEELVAGRNPKECQIVLEEPQISRIHCSIVYDANTEEYIVLNQSKNGMFFDNHKVMEKGREYRLAPKTKIGLAKGTVEFILG